LQAQSFCNLGEIFFFERPILAFFLFGLLASLSMESLIMNLPLESLRGNPHTMTHYPWAYAEAPTHRAPTWTEYACYVHNPQLYIHTYNVYWARLRVMADYEAYQREFPPMHSSSPASSPPISPVMKLSQKKNEMAEKHW
jgi:hypothetical protein